MIYAKVVLAVVPRIKRLLGVGNAVRYVAVDSVQRVYRIVYREHGVPRAVLRSVDDPKVVVIARIRLEPEVVRFVFAPQSPFHAGYGLAGSDRILRRIRLAVVTRIELVVVHTCHFSYAVGISGPHRRCDENRTRPRITALRSITHGILDIGLQHNRSATRIYGGSIILYPPAPIDTLCLCPHKAKVYITPIDLLVGHCMELVCGIVQGYAIKNGNAHEVKRILVRSERQRTGNIVGSFRRN